VRAALGLEGRECAAGCLGVGGELGRVDGVALAAAAGEHDDGDDGDHGQAEDGPGPDLQRALTGGGALRLLLAG
jgi:hypothetical protein